MNRYVNLNDAAQALAHNMKDITQKQIAIGILLDVPEADVKPVIHARWIECGDNQPMSCDKVYCCSNCRKGHRLFNFTPFCAECGADMENWNETKT